VEGGDPVNAIEVMKQVEVHGGSLYLEHGQLRVRAPAPLPEELMEALSAQKPAIMIALGAPIDATIASILADIRPYLSPALKKLPDERLLALVNSAPFLPPQVLFDDTGGRPGETPDTLSGGSPGVDLRSPERTACPLRSPPTDRDGSATITGQRVR